LPAWEREAGLGSEPLRDLSAWRPSLNARAGEGLGPESGAERTRERAAGLWGLGFRGEGGGCGSMDGQEGVSGRGAKLRVGTQNLLCRRESHRVFCGYCHLTAKIAFKTTSKTFSGFLRCLWCRCSKTTRSQTSRMISYYYANTNPVRKRVYFVRSFVGSVQRFCSATMSASSC